MSIESIYPYIAVAYGTFGIVFGVMLWWKTQRRIDRTKSAIELQVANAVTDISSKVDEKLGGIASLTFDTTPLMAAIDERLEQVPSIVTASVKGEIMGLRSAEAKQISKAMEDMGINFEGAAAEAAEYVEGQLPPEMIAMKKLLTTKIPKAVREDNPGWAFILEQARQIGGGMILGRMQQRAGIGGVAVEQAQESGWTPGARR